MSDFSEKFDMALQTLGYPMGALAFDLARTPGLTVEQFDELLYVLTKPTGD
jgi:hypothetical protein